MGHQEPPENTERSASRHHQSGERLIDLPGGRLESQSTGADDRSRSQRKPLGNVSHSLPSIARPCSQRSRGSLLPPVQVLLGIPYNPSRSFHGMMSFEAHE